MTTILTYHGHRVAPRAWPDAWPTERGMVLVRCDGDPPGIVRVVDESALKPSKQETGHEQTG